MITELQRFWAEERKVQIDNKWYKLAEFIQDKYIPKDGTKVSVTIEGDMVTFIQRAKSDNPGNSRNSGGFVPGNQAKRESNTKHVAQSGLSNEELVATLDRISAENNVFATQTHYDKETDSWAFVSFIKG